MAAAAPACLIADDGGAHARGLAMIHVRQNADVPCARMKRGEARRDFVAHRSGLW